MSQSKSSASAQDLPSVNPLYAIYADKCVGECFEFGCYPQGANGEVEPITWRVLQRNADHLLVIAEQGLDCQPYHEEYWSITWADCTLRHWLNIEFYDMAFNEQERQCILETSVVNNAGPDTEDCVFLLSDEETEILFAYDSVRCAKPTEYAVEKGAFIDDDSGCSRWWLRSRGFVSDYAAYVSAGGDVDVDGSCVDSDVFFAVRPAFKIALAAPAPSQPSALSKPATAPTPSVTSLRDTYANKCVGECFEFGRYPQGANGEVEPITWRVLKREADHLLVIAERGLDCKPYHAKTCDITWADCTLRTWLNDEFYDKAFSQQEQKCILETSIVNNAGPNTEDYVFLLSVDEAERLFANDEARCAKPTKYVYRNGIITYYGYCPWLLRSRGHSGYFAASVRTDGSVSGHGDFVSYDDIAVRPALRVAL